MAIKDMTGQQFGRLTVIGLASIPKGKQAKWFCQCSCGKEVIVGGYHLRSGHTSSCGCLRLETIKATHTTHGMSSSGTRGKSVRLYNIWANMKGRCLRNTNPEFSDYGGRGIVICEEWLSFGAFAKWALDNGYSDDLSIDRIDVDGPYCPENCRWATVEQQQNNKRNNHLVTVDGITHTIAEWSKISGIKYDTIERRINAYGWSLKDAVTIPPHGRR